MLSQDSPIKHGFADICSLAAGPYGAPAAAALPGPRAHSSVRDIAIIVLRTLASVAACAAAHPDTNAAISAQLESREVPAPLVYAACIAAAAACICAEDPDIAMQLPTKSEGMRIKKAVVAIYKA